MALFDWFRKKDAATTDEVSPGGSKYIRHGDMKQSMPGLTEFSTLPYIETREAAYQQMFGRYAVVYDDDFPGLVPHIDVYVHEPSVGRDFYTLVTGGMSDLPMSCPTARLRTCRGEPRSCFTCRPIRNPSREYVSFLRTSARFVFDYQTWLTWGHTIPNGDPPKPIFDGSPFVSVLFLFPLFKPDNQLAEQLVLDGDPVSFLWIVPLTHGRTALQNGARNRALQEAFNRARLPFVFNEKRASCL